MLKIKEPWVKNLYSNRDYPDNHTDTKFLEELQKNLHVQKVTFSEAAIGSLRVTQRICFCVLYVLLFVYMNNNWINTNTVTGSLFIGTLVGYICFLLMKTYIKGEIHQAGNMTSTQLISDFKIVLGYLVLGFMSSPTLHMLTDTVSTDTIYALTACMMIIHLLFFDYGVSAAIVSNSLSINAAIFASICLVSRLSTSFDAFILLTVSVIMFVLSQPLIKITLDTSIFLLIFSFTLVGTLSILTILSNILLYYFLILILFINVFCPFLFVKWQSYKDNIHGPWDEAIIEDTEEFMNY